MHFYVLGFKSWNKIYIRKKNWKKKWMLFLKDLFYCKPLLSVPVLDLGNKQVFKGDKVLCDRLGTHSSSGFLWVSFVDTQVCASDQMHSFGSVSAIVCGVPDACVCLGMIVYVCVCCMCVHMHILCMCV